MTYRDRTRGSTAVKSSRVTGTASVSRSLKHLKVLIQSLRNNQEVLQRGGRRGTHRSWEEVQRPSREDIRCFLCLSVHRSNQRSTRFTRSSNSWRTQKSTRNTDGGFQLATSVTVFQV